MNTERQTFTKQERIVSKKLIEQLFGGNDSQSLSCYPVRVRYMVYSRPEGTPPVQVLVSVSKKRFKLAVKRNRAKRQIREAYRLNKQLLVKTVPDEKAVAAAFIWMANEPVDSRRVHHSVKTLLERMAKKMSGNE